MLWLVRRRDGDKYELLEQKYRELVMLKPFLECDWVIDEGHAA